MRSIATRKRVQDKRVQGAAKSVRREDGAPMEKPFGPGIGSSSARADTFRPSLGADQGRIRRKFKERRSLFAVRMGRQWESPSDQALAYHPQGPTRSAPPLGADHDRIGEKFKERRNRFAVRMGCQWKSPSVQALAHHPQGRTRSAPPWVPITTYS
jgi:hypothetical protein